MSDTPIKFKHGELENLDAIAPSTSTEGTIYIAKTANNRAYMYADFDGVRYDITSPNRVYYGISSDESETIKTAIAEDFTLEPGATVTILFTTPLVLNNATLNINSAGTIEIVYRGNVVSKKSLPANSVYTFIYINSQFHLIGDLDQVNNGIAVRTTNFRDANTPVLIADKPVTTDTKSITAMTNPETQITANISQGTMTVPGGIYTAGYNDDSGNWQTINYTNQGIDYYDEDEGDGGFSIYFNPSEIKCRSNYSGRIFTMDTTNRNTNLHTSLNIEGYGECSFNIDGDINTDTNVYSQGYRLPRVYSGTSEPDEGTGEDGDIYIMYS